MQSITLELQRDYWPPLLTEKLEIAQPSHAFYVVSFLSCYYINISSCWVEQLKEQLVFGLTFALFAGLLWWIFRWDQDTERSYLSTRHCRREKKLECETTLLTTLRKCKINITQQCPFVHITADTYMTSFLLQYGRGLYSLTSAMREGLTALTVFTHWHLKIAGKK